MRRRLTLLVAATTSLVLIAFIVPLGYLVREVAADRAVGAATRKAEALAPVVATVDRSVLRLTLSQVAAGGAGKYPLTVFLPDGAVLGVPAARSSGVDLAAQGRSLVVDTGDGREILVAVQGVDGGTAVVRTFVSSGVLHEGVLRAWAVLAVLGVALLALGLVLADRLAQNMVRPMADLAGVSHRLGTGDLEARVRPSGPPELRDVGRSLNHLAGRIGELLAHEREGVADLSHRLRTPLTTLRLDSEALRDAEESARLSADVDALSRTVDEVIHEARRPVREGVGAACDAAVVTRGRVEFWSALAEEEHRSMTVEIPESSVPVRVSEGDLVAVLDALLGNVFAHTPPGTSLAVRLFGVPGVPHSAGAGARLVVSDDGAGFGDPGTDPTQRGESSAASTGLGLDIVRRTADASGGYVTTGASRSGGAEVTVVLGAPADTDREG